MPADAAAWVGLPAAFLLSCLGTGLLAERLVRVTLPAVLLVPLGLCVSVTLVLPVYVLGANAWVAGPLLLVATVAGLVLGRAGLRSRLRPGPATLAALVVFLVYLSPSLFAGSWTWTGYNFLNDTAVQFLLTDQLAREGADKVTGELSTRSLTLAAYLDTAYPLGSHAHLATLKWALGARVEVVYLAHLAMLVIAGMLALVGLATRLGLGAASAALAGAGAVGANLLFAYALQGSIKEVAIFATLMATVALGREMLASPKPARSAVLVGVGAAASLCTLSAAAGPYLVALALALVAGAFVLPTSPARRRLPQVALAGIATTLLAGLVAVLASLTFLRVANVALGADSATQSTLGQLGKPVDLYQIGGVWLKGSYALPIAFEPAKRTATIVWCVVVLVLALGALVATLRRREPGLLVLVATVLLAAAAMAPRASPYADAKLLMVASPAVVFGALVLLLGPGRRRWVGGLLVAAVLTGLAWSDAYALHDTQLAPTARLERLTDAIERGPDRGLILLNEYEEFAKYYGRERSVNVGFEAITPRAALGGSLSADLDELDPNYPQAFGAIVLRRGASKSRPPGNFTRVYANAAYETWTRDPGIEVLDHLPLQGSNRAADAPTCRRVRALARRARRAGATLLAAGAPEVVGIDTANHTPRPRDWPARAFPGDTVETLTPGVVRSVERVDGGEYDAWVKASTGRDLVVRVNRQEVGRVDEINTIGQWQRAGRVSLPPGDALLELERVGGSIRPGDGALTTIGPVQLVRRAAPELVEVAPAEAERRLCRRSWDWIEVVDRG